MSGELLASEFCGEVPVGVVALEDAVAVAIEAEGNSVGGDDGVQAAEIAQAVFRFPVESLRPASGWWHRPGSQSG